MKTQNVKVPTQAQGREGRAMNPQALLRAFREVFSNATVSECITISRAMDLYQRTHPNDRQAIALDSKLERLAREYDSKLKSALS